MVLAIALLAQSAGVERGREREKEGEREYKKNNFNNSKTKKRSYFTKWASIAAMAALGAV